MTPMSARSSTITAMTGPLLFFFGGGVVSATGTGATAVGGRGTAVGDHRRVASGSWSTAAVIGVPDDRLAAPEAHEVGAQVVGGLVPVVRVLGEAREDDPLELGRDRRDELARRRPPARARACTRC